MRNCFVIRWDVGIHYRTWRQRASFFTFMRACAPRDISGSSGGGRSSRRGAAISVVKSDRADVERCRRPTEGVRCGVSRILVTPPGGSGTVGTE